MPSIPDKDCPRASLRSSDAGESAIAPRAGPLKMSAKADNRYRVLQTEPGSDKVAEVGVVALSDDHKLRLISAAPKRREFLDKLLTRLNGADVIHVVAAPPPGAERGDIYTRPIRRSDAAFRQALTDRLKTRYDIELKPA
jgi:hypothetical protein